MDMVCEKNNDCDHDFDKDPLDLYIEDGFLKARGTTLGADDGVAVAYMLSILEDDTLKHPALECVFTVQEEVGLFGASHLKKEYFKATRMIGLDGGGEVETCISSSGGCRVALTRPVKIVENTKACYRLEVKGLLGGHSGGCIHLERGNANKIAFRILNEMIREGLDIQLVDVVGGLKENAIPRECVVVFASQSSLETLKSVNQRVLEALKEELEFSDAGIETTVENETPRNHAMCPHCSKDIIKMMYLLPSGFKAKSMAIEGLTTVSLNMGVVRVENEALNVYFSIRSPMKSAIDDLYVTIDEIASLFGATIERGAEYPGWNYDQSSFMRHSLAKFLETKGQTLVEQAAHGGLETGILKGLLPDLDIITFGPIAFDCHTPDERLDVASFERTYTTLTSFIALL